MAWTDYLNPIEDASKILGAVTGSTAGAEAAQGAAQLQYQLGQQELAAQKDIGEKNLALQQEFLKYQQSSRQTATQMAMPTAAELAAQSSTLQLYDMSIQRSKDLLSRDTQLLASIDPTIKAAGEQLLGLMQGKAAPILDPMQKQIDIQRQGLKNTLADRLGPGWETSTAGIEAMQRFESNAQMTIAQAQQGATNTLANLLGTGVQSASSIGAIENQNLSTTNAIGGQAFSQAQGLVGQQVNAYLGAPVNIVPQQTMPNYSNLMSAAGQTGIGGIFQSQQQGQLVNTGIMAGAMYAAAG